MTKTTYTHFYPIYLYDCKNVKIDNVNIDGQGIDTKIERLILSERYLENVTIANVLARYMKMGLFYYTDDADLNLKAGVKGLRFKNIDLVDCVVMTSIQPLINFNQSFTPQNGTYLYEDIEIENVTSLSTIDRTITPLALNTGKYAVRGNGNAPVSFID